MNKLSLKPLPSLALCESGKIQGFSENKEINRRLLDMGLIKGTKVSCVLKNPSGNPSAFLIRGAIIALRNEDCSHIIVEV